MGALVLLIIEMLTLDINFNLTHLTIGFLVSMIFAFFTIKLFLDFVERIGMIPFVIYRIFLGIFLLFRRIKAKKDVAKILSNKI